MNDNLETIFKTIDKDGSNSLDKEELADAFEKAFPNNGRPTPEEIDRIMKHIDEDGDGKIECAFLYEPALTALRGLGQPWLHVHPRPR